MRLLQDGDRSVLFPRFFGLTHFLFLVMVVLWTANCASSNNISDVTAAGEASTVARRPARQTEVAPQFHDDRAADVKAIASAINKTINTKAVSVDQLNRFCDQADLLRPDTLTTSSEEEKLEVAKGAVMKQVRGITRLEEIQKVATVATAIFGPPTP